MAALRVDQSELLRRPEKRIGEKAAARLAEFATRRLAGEPVARILKSKEFWGLPLKLSAATLVPRPDTETAVELALEMLHAARRPDRRWRIAPAQALMVLLKNLLLCREPLYGVAHWAARYEPAALDLDPQQIAALR